MITGLPGAVVAAFFTGALLVETLFSLDGLGFLSYNSIIHRDYPVVLGSIYLFTLIGLVIKLHVRPAVRPGRSARAVRQGRQMSEGRSPWRRAWERFKRHRVGYFSLWVFLVLLAIALVSPLIANEKPLLVHYQGKTYLTDLQQLPRNAVRGRLPDTRGLV